jgi:hypothetical protein
MSQTLYNPFTRFNFNESTCFLTGESSLEKITVFPDWLIDLYQLDQKPFKLLDERLITYKDITVPCSKTAETAINNLEKEISEAFTAGFEKVKKLDQIKLFQWIGKLVYGIIHYEIRQGIRQQMASGEAFNFSQSLVHKFSNLQLMLQSLTRPFEFEGVFPGTILIFPVDNPPDTFSYRDEVNTLTFSFKMHDFSIIACLQDNGANKDYHQETLNKIKGQKLHPIQFEEVCAKFFYSAYLFNRLPEYTFLPTEEAVYVECMPFYSLSGKPLFDAWQNKTYGQVLENFWKQWGFSLFEIIKDPEKPMDYLFTEEGAFRNPNSIEHPV